MTLKMSREPSISHFVAIADPSVRFDDSAIVADSCGCVVAECDDPHFADGLIDLFHRTNADQEVKLAVLPAGDLSRAQLVLAQRELERARSIGANLDSEEYATNDPTFALIGYVAITLVNLAAELEAVADIAPHSSGETLASPNDRPANNDAGITLHDAIQQLEQALDRHRLTFLFFATAKRRNELLRNSRHGMEEAVRKDDMTGYDRVMDDIDDDGQFLFRQRVYFERFAEKAIGAFGPGEGEKPPGEESTHPFWSLDEGSASYLQDTAQGILAAARELDRTDSARTCKDIVRSAIDVAYDEGRSRWYSAIVTRWAYLTRLDDALAAVRRLLLNTSDVDSQANHAPWDDCYLGVEWHECVYNHDPVSCGVCPDDPNYLPASSGRCYFYKCFYDIAERLIRLFDKGIRPQLSSDGETKRNVSFFMTPSQSMDDDEAFLVDEQLDTLSTEVFARHHDWRLEQGMVMAEHMVVMYGAHLIDQKPPLGDASLAPEFLFDRADRWKERMFPPERRPKSAEKAANEEPKKAESAIDGAHPLLPTAVVAAMSLRDLTRIAKYYPDAIENDEVHRLFEKLRVTLEGAAKSIGIGHVFDQTPLPALGSDHADVSFAAIMATVMMNHKDFDYKGEIDSNASCELHQQLLKKCMATCNESIKDIAEQLHRIRLFDCLVPTPDVGPDFSSPRRLIRLVELYWNLLRQLLLHHSSASITYRPHPLRLMLVSMQRRFRIVFSRLENFQIEKDVPGDIDALIDTLIDGDPDELTVDEEWTTQRFEKIDRFIEDIRSRVGVGVFELTYAEADFRDYCELAIKDYVGNVNKTWHRMLNKSAQKQTPDAKDPPAAIPSPASRATGHRIAVNDLSETRKLILQAVCDLGATDEVTKVSAPKIAAKLRVPADNRLRKELADLRMLKLLGGEKGTQGYWLTEEGSQCVVQTSSSL